MHQTGVGIYAVSEIRLRSFNIPLLDHTTIVLPSRALAVAGGETVSNPPPIVIAGVIGVPVAP